MADAFTARDTSISMRMQRMILSRMASTNSTRKIVIDDITASLLDSLFQVVHLYTKNIKDAEKLVKYIIKIVVKVEVMYRNNGFTEADLECVDKFKRKFFSAAMTVLSFHGVEYTYDRQFLISLLQEAHAHLRQVVENHFKEKSVRRLEAVFFFFTNPTFLDNVFKRGSEFKEILDKMVQDINTAYEEKRL